MIFTVQSEENNSNERRIGYSRVHSPKLYLHMQSPPAAMTASKPTSSSRSSSRSSQGFQQPARRNLICGWSGTFFRLSPDVVCLGPRNKSPSSEQKVLLPSSLCGPRRPFHRIPIKHTLQRDMCVYARRRKSLRARRCCSSTTPCLNRPRCIHLPW